jgi:hypothetical protein
MGKYARMFKATSIANGVTMLSIAPLAVFHIVAPIFAPMVGGYWAGSNLRMTERESVVLGVVTVVLVGIPLPFIQQVFGYFHYLSPLAIDFFAITFALYAGGLVGIFAWLGGSSARADEAW